MVTFLYTSCWILKLSPFWPQQNSFLSSIKNIPRVSLGSPGTQIHLCPQTERFMLTLVGSVLQANGQSSTHLWEGSMFCSHHGPGPRSQWGAVPPVTHEPRWLALHVSPPTVQLSGSAVTMPLNSTRTQSVNPPPSLP